MSFDYELPDLSKLTAEDIEGNSPLQEYISKQLLMLLTQKQNLHGRRIGKAKDAVNPGDYVTKRQVASNLFGVLAERPAPKSVTEGTTYTATDRGSVTYQSRGGHWWYLYGIQDVTLSPNTKPNPSVPYDNGYLIYATDFDWYYRWNLITWERLNGANRFIQGFAIAPTKPGWGLSDGTIYTISTDSGGTTTFNSFDMVSGGSERFSKFGGSYIAVAAVVPTLSGSTGSGGAHTPTGSISGYVELPDLTHAHPINHTVDGGDLAPGATVGTLVNVVSADSCEVSFLYEAEAGGTSLDVAKCNHSHLASLADGSVSGNWTHSHSFEGYSGDALDATEGFHLDFVDATFTGTPVSDHAHGVGTLTVSSTGSPIAVQLIPYIRL